MPEKGRAKATVQRTATQTSLRDHFRRADTGISNTAKTLDVHTEHSEPKAVSTVDSEVPVPLCLPAAEPVPPTTLSDSATPSQLFPIFTQVYSKRVQPSNEVVDVDAIDIIDITSDNELSEIEPPLSSTHCPSPRSEMDYSAAPSSPPPPPSPLSTSVESHHSQGSLVDTSFPCVNAGEHTHPPKISKRKESKNRNMWDQGDDVPFPSSCSQHVRGPQRSYTFSQALPKRDVEPALSMEEKGSLDFLAKPRQPDGPSTNHLEHIHRSLTHEQRDDYFQTVSRDYAESHPAFAQIYAQRENTPSRHAEMWTRRFRPRRANEVLGNERKALYLRDWLSALQLHWRDGRPEEPVETTQTKGSKQKNTAKSIGPRGVKRPRVIRAVDRKRGNKKRRIDSDDDLDDFVAFSDEEPDDADLLPENSEDEFTFCQNTLSRIHRRNAALTQATPSDLPESDNKTTQLNEPSDADFSNHLTNTLLITGPPGCGKTAAVYACAEELGWDVFEVYPGVGRRNGASLDHLVGDVGRNHIVQTGHSRASTRLTKLEPKQPMELLGFSTKNKTGLKTSFAKMPEAGTEVEPISVDAESPTNGSKPFPPNQQSARPDPDDKALSTMPAAELLGPHPIVRQSLVLLEEVDILFKEDAGFWPAVVDFIRQCRRPVVMTCNDVGLVPLADLPLQTTLAFEPCPSPVAATFLQCLSLTEGCRIPHEDLMALYQTTHTMNGLGVPDASLYPRTEPLPLADLRRSITQLQMFCAGATHGSTSKKHQGDEAGEHVRRSARPISAESSATPLQSKEEREWWRKMSSHTELLSHVDAQLCRPPLHTPEALSMACSSTPSTDDELGYVVLPMASHVSDTRDGLEIYHHDELIAEDAIRISRGIHEVFATGPIDVSINPAARPLVTNEDARWFRSRVVYQSQMVEALQHIIQPPAPLMPQSSVFLDYIPWVRYMVAVDDILERMAWDGMEKGRSGRSTRNSMRTRHTRTVELNERQREMLMVSRLGCDE